ncbi:hypothetical protein F4861DRAFT_537491 [Xylaria intraflava]|nr:hypothetical protein F4861DRAFT_537491 [Xylaria intraflava]
MGDNQIEEWAGHSPLVTAFESFTNKYISAKIKNTLMAQGIETSSDTGTFFHFLMEGLHDVAQEIGHMVSARVQNRTVKVNENDPEEYAVLELAIVKRGREGCDNPGGRILSGLHKWFRTMAPILSGSPKPAKFIMREVNATLEMDLLRLDYTYSTELDMVRIMEKSGGSLNLGVFGWLPAESGEPEMPYLAGSWAEREENALQFIESLAQDLSELLPANYSSRDREGPAQILATIQKLSGDLTSTFRRERCEDILQLFPPSLQYDSFYKHIVESVVNALHRVACRKDLEIWARLIVGRYGPHVGIILNRLNRPRGAQESEFDDCALVLVDFESNSFLSEYVSMDGSMPNTNEAHWAHIIELFKGYGANGIDLGPFGL